jgi:hypothetical protein
MEKHPRITIAACLIVSAICIVFILFSGGQKSKSPPLNIQSTNTQADLYSPPIAKADVPQEISVVSPDGKWALKMSEEKGENDTTYIFWILNLVKSSQKEIFRKTVPSGSALTIPQNTFSPDDKYVFIKENSAGDVHYLVLSASGAPLAKGIPTMEISGLFAAKYPDYKITDVTGWGGQSLIVINTDKNDGGQGPSFWFDVGSGSFIQLGTRFN